MKGFVTGGCATMPPSASVTKLVDVADFQVNGVPRAKGRE